LNKKNLKIRYLIETKKKKKQIKYILKNKDPIKTFKNKEIKLNLRNKFFYFFLENLFTTIFFNIYFIKLFDIFNCLIEYISEVVLLFKFLRMNNIINYCLKTVIFLILKFWISLLFYSFFNKSLLFENLLFYFIFKIQKYYYLKISNFFNFKISTHYFFVIKFLK